MATELRALVAQWREAAAETKYAMYEAVYTECADALDAALTAAEDARENVSAGTTNRTAPGTVDPRRIQPGDPLYIPTGPPRNAAGVEFRGTAPKPSLNGMLFEWRIHGVTAYPQGSLGRIPADKLDALLTALVREVADLRALVDRAAREDGR